MNNRMIKVKMERVSFYNAVRENVLGWKTLVKVKRENRSGTVSRKTSMGKRIACVTGVKGKHFALNRVEPRVVTRLF
jgi:hypothetical protein